MELYSILLIVDSSPTFYCLPKPLFFYGSMVLFIGIISTIFLTMYDSVYVLLWLVALHGD